MTLRVSDFDQYILGSDQINYVEVRLSEQIVIPFSVTDELTKVPINISSWAWSVSYKDATATVTGTGKVLSSINNFTLLSMNALTDSNLLVTNVMGPQGTAVLAVPSTVTAMPSTSAVIDAQNTLVKLISIVATYPSGVTTVPNIRNLAMGLIIRFA